MAASSLISIVEAQLSNILKEQVQELRDAMGVETAIRNLSLKLKTITVILNEAEKRSLKEDLVKHWVEQIQDFSYDADDVLDEWRTRRLQIERSEDASCCCSFLSFVVFRFKRLVMHRDIALKIKKLDSTLDDIKKDKDQFNFLAVANTSASLHPDQESKRVTTPFDVDATEIQGRKSDANALISKLVENNGGEEARNGHPVVISIVGQGGIGKTTLAHLVYHDLQIKTHFHESVRVWVSVSHPFDQIKIAKAIVESITKKSTNLSQLSVLLETIQNILSEKRFLLVLDDVWTEKCKDWEPFKNCLKVGLPGSRILVTTRSEKVARMMASVYLHPVDIISDSDAWLLLSRTAFSGRREEEPSEKLKEIGQGIAQKCKGLPLAVSVMGRLLSYKDTEEEWQSVFDSRIWEMEEVETDLFPHLYLSYDDLTPQMKLCFLYCAIFPKDYTIVVDELIRLWMAQGYITTTNGREVFCNLAMRSLFQEFQKDDMDSNIIIACKMHDIVHDFVEFLTRNKCYSIGRHEDKMKIENLRHLSWKQTRRSTDLASICDVTGKLGSFLAEDRYPEQLTPNMFNGLKSTNPASIYDVTGKLRSFFAEDLYPEQLTPNMFNGLKSVRVLGLHGCMLSKLPKEIGNLLHLRYIDLSQSEVDELPDAICSLANLQTLDLRGCVHLSRLPEGIGNLRHLRYIDLNGSKVEELPDSICSLANLQTLNLRGCVHLSRLPEGIGNLRHLRYIDLSDNKVEELPDSICSLANLQTLDLGGCECLSRLPEKIENLCHLRYIDLCWSKVKEFDAICFLNNLQTLNLRGCKGLSRLPEGVGNLCNLKYINLSETDVEELPNDICSLDNLRWIDLSDSKVASLPDAICYLNNLQILNLEGCEYLSRLPKGIGNLRHLRYINLSGSKVDELPDSICYLDNLQTLYLRRCECLSSLPEGIGNLCHLRDIDLSGSNVEELPNSICSLDSLQTLDLGGCEYLSRLPEGIGNLRKLRCIDISWSKVEELPNAICSLNDLQTLNLEGCECLYRLPEGIGNLRHLKLIDLTSTKIEILPDSIYSLNNLEIRGH